MNCACHVVQCFEFLGTEVAVAILAGKLSPLNPIFVRMTANIFPEREWTPYRSLSFGCLTRSNIAASLGEGNVCFKSACCTQKRAVPLIVHITVEPSLGLTRYSKEIAP